MASLAILACVSLASAPAAALRSVTLAFPAEPTEPGCYVWMPSGCSNSSLADAGRAEDIPEFWSLLDQWHDMATQWVRDVHGITKHQAGVNRQACEQKRRHQFNQWCHRDDAEMKFVGGLEPVKPMTPGCYVWFPSGCQRHEFHAKTQWRKIGDPTKAACEEVAPNKYNSWCGNSDAKTLFIRDAPPKPKEPGCYVWMPTGCTRHPFSSKLAWKLDSSGEGARQALMSKSVCEVERRELWNNHCGDANARMFHVPLTDSRAAATRRTDEPADEVRVAPASSDLPDALGAAADAPRVSKPLTFPVGAPAQPEKPGCYVWMPQGCRHQRFSAQARWVPTPFDSPDECASKGRIQYSSWCGVEDAQMLWVATKEATTAKEGSNNTSKQVVVGSASSPPHGPDGAVSDGRPAEAIDESFVVQGHHLAVEEPAEPGCYVRMPSGCGAAGQNASLPPGVGDVVYGDDSGSHSLAQRQREWRRDSHGIRFQKAGVDREACEEKRRDQFNSYCQRADVQMKFVAGMAPTTPMLPGCYVWLPTGCPKHHFHAKHLWRRTDETNRTECEMEVAHRFNSWCGRDDAHSIFISEPPRKPTEPGCYVWMPSGCTRHPFASKMSWKLDQTGMDGLRASSGGKARCEVERKDHWNSFCGESNARMAYVSACSDVPLPSECHRQPEDERKYK